MSVLLVILAVLAGLVGLLCLSSATLGVGILAGACLLGILARIAQAGEHQETLVKMLTAIRRSIRQ